MISVQSNGTTTGTRRALIAAPQTTDFIQRRFASHKSRGIRELTPEEIALVNGGAVNVAAGAAIGAVWGGASYLTSDSNITAAGLAMSVGSGAIAGAIASMGGVSFAFYGGGLGMVGQIASQRISTSDK